MPRNIIKMTGSGGSTAEHKMTVGHLTKLIDHLAVQELHDRVMLTVLLVSSGGYSIATSVGHLFL